MAQRAGIPAAGSRPGRIVALAVPLVLTVVVARVRSGDAPPAGPAGGAVGEWVGKWIGVVGLVLLAGVLVLLVLGHRWHRAGPGAARSDGPPRLSAGRRAGVLAAAPLGLLMVGAVEAWLSARHPPPPMRGASPPGSSSGWEQPTWLIALGAVVALVAVVARLPGRSGASGTEPIEVVARAVAAGRARVRDTAAFEGPRQAIIACFRAMEDALARAGPELAPREADTPAEVLARAFAVAAVPQRPARDLLALFQEARFSDHPMGEPRRIAADRALSAILAALPRRGGR